jgi:hypothetical protein
VRSWRPVETSQSFTVPSPYCPAGFSVSAESRSGVRQEVGRDDADQERSQNRLAATQRLSLNRQRNTGPFSIARLSPKHSGLRKPRAARRLQSSLHHRIRLRPVRTRLVGVARRSVHGHYDRRSSAGAATRRRRRDGQPLHPRMRILLGTERLAAQEGPGETLYAVYRTLYDLLVRLLLRDRTDDRKHPILVVERLERQDCAKYQRAGRVDPHENAEHVHHKHTWRRH